MFHLSVFEENGADEDASEASKRVTRVARSTLIVSDNLKSMNEYHHRDGLSKTKNYELSLIKIYFWSSYVVQDGADVDQCKQNDEG